MKSTGTDKLQREDKIKEFGGKFFLGYPLETLRLMVTIAGGGESQDQGREKGPASAIDRRQKNLGCWLTGEHVCLTCERWIQVSSLKFTRIRLQKRMKVFHMLALPLSAICIEIHIVEKTHAFES